MEIGYSVGDIVTTTTYGNEQFVIEEVHDYRYIGGVIYTIKNLSNLSVVAVNQDTIRGKISSVFT